MTDDPGDPSLRELFGQLAVLEARVRRSVARRRSADPSPDDPFRGLYLSDDDVDRIIDSRQSRVAESDPGEHELRARIAEEADAAQRTGARLRLRQLAAAFVLASLDVDLLLVALAPDLDARFERLYGYLNDDVTRRRATLGLALELAGASALSAAARSRLAAGAPLVDRALIVVEDADRPLLTRGLRVPDRVAAHLLGDDTPDPALTGLLAEPVPPVEAGDAVAGAIRAGARLVYLRERAGTAARSVAVEGLRRAGLRALVLDLERLSPEEPVVERAVVAAREASLVGAGLVAGPVEALVERGTAAVRAFAELPGPMVLLGRRTWDPAWSSVVPLLTEAPMPTPADRVALWRAAANGLAGGSANAPTAAAFAGGSANAPTAAADPAALAAQFTLAPEDVVRSVRAARLLAAADAVPVTTEHLLAGARAQNSGGLERLARRIEPVVGWDDLVLAPWVLAQLHELAARARNRTQVLDGWRMRPGGGRGRGVAALFAGDPGTGKTMAAEVVAHALGFDLYAVNLATVVDKYIGETEKNLERIFSEAEGVNGVLLFDEADALFGKRSEVSDAHDRHANVEVAYLLQRMESFDGIAVLATNLRANLDEAFARRLDVIVDFALPDAAGRRALWERCLGGALPRGDDVDLDFCARSFELSGGGIRSIAVTAAYLAAAAGRPVSMADLMRATQAEYRKLGRLVLEAEFGQWATASSKG